MSDFAEWIKEWTLELFKDLYEMFIDLMEYLFSFLFQLVELILSVLPVPEFMNASLVTYINIMPSYLLYALEQINFSQGLGIIAAGILFRISRKLVTLFQW